MVIGRSNKTSLIGMSAIYDVFEQQDSCHPESTLSNMDGDSAQLLHQHGARNSEILHKYNTLMVHVCKNRASHCYLSARSIACIRHESTSLLILLATAVRVFQVWMLLVDMQVQLPGHNLPPIARL
jgi:hypothetical protein